MLFTVCVYGVSKYLDTVMSDNLTPHVLECLYVLTVDGVPFQQNCLVT